MDQQKVAFVDVDNTLWDFDAELKKRMIALGHKVPEEWPTWTEPEKLMGSPKAAHNLFNEMHYDQLQFEPFREAKLVLKDLRRMKYKILIATNRIPETEPYLVSWLNQHELVFDEVYCNLGKHTLLNDRKIDLVIDDAPYMLEAALDRDIRAMSIRYSYNKDIRGVTRFRSLKEMHDFLIREMVMSI